MPSPKSITKPGQNLTGICGFPLHSFSHVENWTITRSAQNILMQTALTALALRPQLRVASFGIIEMAQMFQVDAVHSRHAVLTHGRILILQNRLTAQTCFLFDGKFHQTTGFGCSNLNCACMITRYQCVKQ
jgi:hypothetical protein